MRLILNVMKAEGRFNNLHVFISIRPTAEGTWEEEGLSSLCTKVETSRIKLKYSGVLNSDLWGAETSVSALLRPLSVTIYWRLLWVPELLKLRYCSRLWRTASRCSSVCCPICTRVFFKRWSFSEDIYTYIYTYKQSKTVWIVFSLFSHENKVLNLI